MAGHSAWKNIRHKKAAADAKRGKLWSKCARAIIVAARNGGGDPETNLTLRYAIDDAKSVNMPKDTIEKAIKKGTGELTSENYEAAIYEGYGPGGIAVMLEILTDNRNRTAPEIKKLFEKAGGNLGASGCVSYLFQAKGEAFVAKTQTDEESLMTLALDAGAEDVQDAGESWRILCSPGQFVAVRQAMETAKLAIESAQMTMVPTMTTACTGETAQKLLHLIDALDDHDDVQKTHTNADITEADLATSL